MVVVLKRKITKQTLSQFFFFKQIFVSLLTDSFNIINIEIKKFSLNNFFFVLCIYRFFNVTNFTYICCIVKITKYNNFIIYNWSARINSSLFSKVHSYFYVLSKVKTMNYATILAGELKHDH